jgi:sigma-E factor negative regulatory protein RseB
MQHINSVLSKIIYIITVSLSNRAVTMLPVFLFFFSYAFPVFAEAGHGPNLDSIKRLNSMSYAVKQKNYEIIFVNSSIDSSANPSFQYIHVNQNGKIYAQLLSLEGMIREIILKDNQVSYKQQDRASFTINSSRIVEVFPDIVVNDFKLLSQYYDYYPIGKARIANRSAQLIRILAKDRDRNSYVLWLDDDTSIPLRIDLYDDKNILLKQFKVVKLTELTHKQSFLNYLQRQDNYPVLVSQDKITDSGDFELNYIPAGFVRQSQSHIDYRHTDISSQLYSDGVFSFSVNVSKVHKNVKTYSLQKGSQIIFTTGIDNKEVTIIGDLPLETIKRIVKNINIKKRS